MPSIVDAFLRLRVDPSQVKKDTEKGLGQVNAQDAGRRAGKQFGAGVTEGGSPALDKLFAHSDKVLARGTKISGEKAGINFTKYFSRAFQQRVDTTKSDSKRNGGLGFALNRFNPAAAGTKAGKQFGDAFGKQANVSIGKQLKNIGRGIGPGIGGLGAKPASILGGGGALLGALPALLGGAAPLAVGALGGGALAGLFAGVQAQAAPAQQALAKAKAQQASAVTPAQQKAAAVSLAAANKQVAALPPGLQSILASEQVITNTWKKFTTSFAPAFAGPVRQVATTFVGLLGPLKQFFTGAFTLAQPLIAGVGDIARVTLPLLGQAFRAAAPFVKPLLDGIAKMVGGLLPGLITLLKAAGPAVAVLAGAFGSLGSGLGQMLSLFAPVIQASSVILKALLQIVVALLPIIGQLAGVFATALAPVVKQFAAVIVSLLPFLVLVGKILAELAGAILGDLSIAFGAIATLLKAIAPSLVLFATALAGVFTTLENSGVFAILGNAITSLAAPLGALVNTLLRGLAPLLPPIITFIGQLAGLLAAQLAAAIRAILPVLIQLAQTAFAVIAQVLPILLPLLLKFAGIFTGVLVAVIAGVADALLTIIKAIPPRVLNLIVIALLAIVGAMKAWSIIQAILDVELSANPIGLIVIAIAALVVGLIEAWKHSALFRSIVIGAFHAVKVAVEAVVNWFKNTFVPFFSQTIPHVFGLVLSWVKANWPLLLGLLTGPIGLAVAIIFRFWRPIVGFFKGIWANIENVFTVAGKAISNWAVTTWTHIYGITIGAWNLVLGFFKAIWGHIENVFTGAGKAILNWAATVWHTILAIISAVWHAIEQAITTALTTVKNLVSSAWTWIASKTTNVFNTISGFFTSVWAGINRTVTTAVEALKRTVQLAWIWISNTTGNIFGGLGKIISTAFNAVKSGIKDAINWGIDRVNDLIVRWDSVGIGPLHLPHINKITHLAGGGQIPGYAPGRDIVPAMLSPGEFVMNPVAARAIGYGNLRAMNAIAGPAGMARGGLVQFLATGGQIASSAVRWAGHRYVWGGGANPTTGFDCSSFANMILGSLGIALPGGFHAPSLQHGPTTLSYQRYGATIPYGSMQPGDLYVNGHHMGIVTGLGRGFAARSTATGTGPQSVPPGAYSIRRGPWGAGGFFSGISGAIAAAFSAVQNAAISAFLKLSASHPKAPPNPFAPVGAGFRYGVGDVMHSQVAAAFAAAQAAAAALFNGATGGNPPGGGTGSNFANGQELYRYLLTNLFGGSKIGAAGATASIWGESNWNPFAVGTGGRGLIGWTPPSKISDAVFRGGMRTQLPAIIDFVRSNGDMGVIANMRRSRSVFDAANLWGRGVERFGINDVHATGVNLATQIMNSAGSSAVTHSSGSGPGGGHHLGKGGLVRRFQRGGLLPEDVYGIGMSGTRYRMEGGERVVGGSDDMLVRELRALRATLEAVPGRTAAGVAKALDAPRGMQAQAARLGAR